jgi:hypothetical protein
MTLNLHTITQDATHRYRAIGSLAGFTAVFMICALALMGGQDHEAIGVEWLVVAMVAAVIYVNGYVQAIRSGGSRRALRLDRVIVGTALYAAQAFGATLFIAGYVAGLYVTSVAVVGYFASLISGAWLLIVGAHRDSGATEAAMPSQSAQQ